MAGNYLNAGTVRIVLGGLIDTQIERERRGERSASCSRLRRPWVDLPVVRARLARRHEGKAQRCSGTWIGCTGGCHPRWDRGSHVDPSDARMKVAACKGGPHGWVRGYIQAP